MGEGGVWGGGAGRCRLHMEKSHNVKANLFILKD